MPDCETEKGCIIPPLSERGQKVMELRERLVRLGDLVHSSTILAAYGATIEDLELLAKAEDLIGSLKNAKNQGRLSG